MDVASSSSGRRRVHSLRRAHRLLNNPRKISQPINAIALACGFGDLSYFNQSFRRRYGTTPTEVREAARWQGDD
jgi:AraC-like DNA-binding protein